MSRLIQEERIRVNSLVNNTEMEHRQSDHLRGFIAALKWVRDTAMPETAKQLNEV